MIAEDSYGTLKRLEFVRAVLDSARPGNVLDVGCGTGNQLTRPLAERFPDVQFLGIDSDKHTIAFAQSINGLPNLSFALEPSGTFDLVIASEVLEHVEDPVEFLLSLHGRLATSKSRVILTVPNGYGPFEIASAVRQVLHGRVLGNLTRRAGTVFRKAKRRYKGAPDVETYKARANTLADSPHINFFTRADIAKVAGAAGFAVESQRGRTLLCGYGLDRLVRGRLKAWNCRLADVAPAVSSDWMFVLKQSERKPGSYLPGRWAAWKRRSPCGI